MTVEELCKRCEKEIQDGNGNAEIILCVNDEEFYALEGSFSSLVYNDSEVYEFLENQLNIEENNAIVLN